ncbi:MAG: nuclear transport factor 2 family protein [Pseudomonadota bacterium]
MKKITLLGTAIALLVLLPTLASASELDDFKAAIKERYDLKVRAFAEDNPDLVVDEFYAPDVFSVDNEGKPHAGREALRPIYHEVVPGSEVRIESKRTHVEGNTGWDWANFYVTPDDPEAEPFSFAILFLWERRDGRWWCVGDMYNLGKL